ncbi:MAG: exosortase H [Candidatus Latescibacteria bacterium]|nr:exosortase H [Candidatus Latescibacterota bacterium]NIO27265.1 exosortase H [Candidatus Latescibacterota bacterium]NIO54789.1 exosortase H [Candidatus Latescibacterota bacterium]NIT00872.1 exosortase H [Candidatus Latescibacterota bacterium]NIT37795.1 exosortase H [Candidatus Latescibacterota bacterium]
MAKKRIHKNSREKKEAPSRRAKRSFNVLFKEYYPIARFILTTIVSLVLFFWLLRVKYFEDQFVAPYTEFVAASSRFFLRLLGIQATGSGSLIASPEFTVNIMYVCNGLEVTAIFFATTLGFPARWRNKLIGLAIGYPVIYLINIFRIVVLFILGFKMPGIFETAHYYYAQAFVIIATVGVWLIWVSLYSAYGSKSSHRISN